MALRQLLQPSRCRKFHFRCGSTAVSVPSVTNGSDIGVEVKFPDAERIELDKYASYKKATTGSSDSRVSSGLVLLLPWTLAKDSHVAKFENYYLKKGLNVLTVHTPTRHLFLSKLYRKKLETVAEELLHPSSINPYSKLLVHAFSIGHFALGQLLLEMDKEKNFNNIPASVVLDSAFDYRTLIFALVRTFPVSTSVQDALYPLCKVLWMKMIPGLGVKPNEKVYERIHQEKFERALILTSNVDPIGTEDYSKRLMEQYRTNGSPVIGKIFESSPHVMHFVKHQKEYLNLLEPFVEEFIKKN